MSDYEEQKSLHHSKLSTEASVNSVEVKKKIPLSAIVLSLALPLVVGKSLIVYFGSNYSDNPGEGYGYGLIIMIVFTVFMAGRFIYKYRHFGQ
jgi:hypothetical protein